MGSLGEFTDGGINPEEHEATGDFTPLPPGWYSAEIEKAEIKDTKTSGGKMLKIQYSIVGEKFNGRKIFESINILNASEAAQAIGRRQLADIARACNIALLDDEDQLLAQTIEIKLAVKHDEGYDPDNEVKGHRPLGGKTATPPAGKAAAPGATEPTEAAPSDAPPKAKAPAKTEKKAPAAKPAGGKMPWER
jgi:hypothetical protein